MISSTWRYSPRARQNSMGIWNLGGITADYFYSVPHIPAPGETLDGANRQVFLGGKGAKGAIWFGAEGQVHIPPIPVPVVDTTSAGDTFTGYVLAGMDQGKPIRKALEMASKAAAIIVTRRGAADVIPDLSDLGILVFNKRCVTAP